MARRIKVFFLVLFASAIFSVSVNAAFTVNDSNNLLNVRSTLSNINQYLGTLNSNIIWAGNQTVDVKNSLVSLRNNLDANFSSLLTDTTNLQSQLTTVSSLLSEIKSGLNQILAALGWRGIAVYHEFQNSLEYCNSWNNGSRIANNSVIPTSSGDAWQYPILNGENVFLAPGVYVVSVSTNTNWFINGSDKWVSNAGSVTVKITGLAQILFKFSSVPSWFVLDIYPADSDQLGDQVFDKVGSSVSDKTSSVNSGVNQLEGLEDQVFGSLDTSLGSIDFSGSALGQVVSGFNFIRSVFSAVYSSSPYISVLINLSCMFGVLALFLRVQPRFSRWEREHRDRSN